MDYLFAVGTLKDPTETFTDPERLSEVDTGRMSTEPVIEAPTIYILHRNPWLGLAGFDHPDDMFAL